MTLITKGKGPAGQPTLVAVFPDFEHVAAYLKSQPSMDRFTYEPATTQRMLATGDPALAAIAERMLATLEQPDAVYADNVPAWGRSVSGAMPDVPAYLAGSPLNMRRRTPQHGLAPLSIVVETYMSGGIGDNDRERRGVAVLALVRKLAMTGHAVDLYMAHTSMHSPATCLIRVETRPLDMARAVWAMVASFEKTGFKSASAEVLYNLKGRADSLQSPFGDPDFPNNPAKLTAYYSPILNAENALIAVPGLCGVNSPFGTDKAARQWLEANYAKATELARQQLAA